MTISQVGAKRRVRRSSRLGLSVPVLVHGKDASGTPFREITRTLSLNANGALLALAASVQEGQTILVENKNTRLEQECRIVNVAPAEDGKSKVGVAFTRIATGFWEIYFPPPVGGGWTR
ncbi:MAG: PilZ domain-containing protein [Acidobacteriaceae bacterium]